MGVDRGGEEAGAQPGPGVRATWFEEFDLRVDKIIISRPKHYFI